MIVVKIMKRSRLDCLKCVCYNLLGINGSPSMRSCITFGSQPSVALLSISSSSFSTLVLFLVDLDIFHNKEFVFLPFY